MRVAKTYKRELAAVAAALFALGWGFALHALAARPEANHEAMVSLLNGTAPWVAALVAGAFGADCYAMQIKERLH